MSQESPKNLEMKEKEPRYDAIHLVVYEVKGEAGNLKPDTHGLMELNVIAELLKQGIAKNVVIGGTRLEISKIYSEALRQRVREVEGITILTESEVLPPEKKEQGAKDTGGEVDFVLKQARQHNWHNILTIGYGPHMERLKKLYASRESVEVSNFDNKNSRANINVTAQSTQKLLEEKHPGFTEKFERSPFRVKEADSFTRGEKRKIVFMNIIDPKGHLISLLAHLIPESINEKLKS